jgi:predicted HTH transcriptional regulator
MSQKPEPLHEDDLACLAEAYDLECKAAQGREGRGELPEDFWKSYSAMANADGGVILLGVREQPPGTFHPLGLRDVERVRKALWDNLHNRKQVSINLLKESDIAPVQIAGKTVLRVQVPRATRQQRPVHLGSNPFGHTWLRRHEGDYVADDEAVRRMLAERVEDSRDARVLKGFDYSDLDMDTVAAYRNRFAAVKPGHVWADLPVPDFLERIGAWGRNREEGVSGLRLVGLLMFGRAEVIRDAVPHYMVDYQEQPPEPKAGRRWIDRLTPDGTWSGNLYDFFGRVYKKLTSDLKVPFRLQEGQRVDDTPVHEALREALANTLIHADYSGRVSVLVVKRPGMFGFRNPGRMRIPPELAIRGGDSDCRNRRLQTMFQLVGYGDHAGSGLPKIYQNWAGQHWRRPVLFELSEPEQTLMELRMSSLLPGQAVTELEARLGQKFHALDETERLALVTAQVEGVVSHGRLKQISMEHPADLTKMLGALVRSGLLVSDGTGRGMAYHLPWQQRVESDFDLDGPFIADGLPSFPPPKPPELSPKPPELSSKPPELGPKPPELTVYLDWDTIPEAMQDKLRELGAPVSMRRKVSASELRDAILALCEGRFLGSRVLACALHRDSDDLRKRTLMPMVQGGLLRAAHPNARDPRQAYTASTPATDQP